MSRKYLCPNEDCRYDKTDGKIGQYCPECGTELENIGASKIYELLWRKKETPEMRKEREEIKKKMGDPKKQIEYVEKSSCLLFYDELSDPSLKISIQQDMKNLASHEAGTKWMRIGTLLSFNSTEQMIGAGFKAVIDQNKILIKQNEQILRELKKLNNNETDLTVTDPGKETR